ncbi:MAG TPA: DUF2007 domain-containing protein [Thermoflexia bacterium]|nr:DUF2007 domain-containing protein [Thermoflexia bacterium]
MDTQKEEPTGLTTIYIAEGILRAMVIQGVLESGGIPAVLSYEAASRAIPVTVGKIGRVRVLVPIEWEKEAQLLLEAKPLKGKVFAVPPNVAVQS